MGFFWEFLTSNTPTGKIYHGRTVRDVPNKKIKNICGEYVSAFCSPPECMESIHKKIKSKYHDKKDVAQMNPVDGIIHWNERKEYAYGMITSLYERDTLTNKFVGDPVADALAVVTHSNCGMLALGDGVSWGQKSKLASNCGIYGSISYLCKNLSSCTCTKDVFRCILRSFENAQKCIVEEEGTMTTLCTGVVVPLQEKGRYVFCVVNVGDSYAYVYNKDSGVQEVTFGSHPLDEVRDMRYSGGALGPADGYNPDLGNLTCSFVVVEEGDIVFLASDGISDNFDPAIAKFTPRFKAEEQTRINAKIRNKTQHFANVQENDEMDNHVNHINHVNHVNDVNSKHENGYEPLDSNVTPSAVPDSTTDTQNTTSDSSSSSANVPSIDVSVTIDNQTDHAGILKHDNKSLCVCLDKKNTDNATSSQTTDSSSLSSSPNELTPIRKRFNCEGFGSHEALNVTHNSFLDPLGSSSNEEDNVSDDVEEIMNEQMETKPLDTLDDKDDKLLTVDKKFHYIKGSSEGDLIHDDIVEVLHYSPPDAVQENNKTMTTDRSNTKQDSFEVIQDDHPIVDIKNSSPTINETPVTEVMRNTKQESFEVICKCLANQDVVDCNICESNKIKSENERSKSHSNNKSKFPKAISSCLKASASDHDIQGCCKDYHPKTDKDIQEHTKKEKTKSKHTKKDNLKSRSQQELPSVSTNGKSKNTFSRTVSEPNKKCKNLLIGNENDETVDAGEIAVQTVTPRERHRGALEQMSQIINGDDTEPINGNDIRAIDVCAQIMNFVVNRTAEKREILEELPPSKLASYTSKERKEHSIVIKKRLEGVPGKLDHASIVAYEVGIHGKDVLKVTKSNGVHPTIYGRQNSKSQVEQPRRQSEPNKSFDNTYCDELECL